MTPLRFALLSALLPLSTLVLHAADAPPAPDEAQGKELFARLSHDDFQVREEATRALVKMGAPALPMLARLVKETTDPEVVERCAFITATISDDVPREWAFLPVSRDVVARPRAYVCPPADSPPVDARATLEIECFQRSADRGPRDPVLILDGQMSTGRPVAPLQYVWKQTGGEALDLKPEKLRKARVGLLIYHPGTYRFQLIVSDGGRRSEPADVLVVVREPKVKVAGAEE